MADEQDQGASTPFLEVYDQIREIVKGRKVTANNIMNLAAQAMQIVEQYPNLTGPEKKEIVLDVARKLLEDIPMEEEQRKTISIIIETALPAAIDLLVSAAGGKLNIQTIKTKVKSCWAGCCSTEQ